MTSRRVQPSGLALACVLGASLGLLGSRPAEAALCGGDPPNLLIVLDKSGSMGSSNKWNDARNAINNLVTTNSGSILFGLMLYPVGSGSCPRTPPQVACGKSTHSAIMSVLASSSPSGGTPTGAALTAAGTYLGGLSAKTPRYVLIITDGCSSSACGNPVTLVGNLSKAGIKTFVVGFGTGTCPSELTGMASAGGTGKYYQANNPGSLNTALKNIAGQVNCCGNGVIDAGERCDTKIPPGSPGACPTSCNDGNPCTRDLLGGSACTIACSYVPVTSAINGDGCCPPGATSLTDTDCRTICGNGLLEAGELCDPGISGGFGRCPRPADCDDKDSCTRDSVVGSSCQQRCQHTLLLANNSVKDSCCPPGASSKTDRDCPVACGNGLLETGETCDPGIKTGPGRCPALADCDDKNLCTRDFLIGGACNRRCDWITVPPNAVTGDGCCPPWANAKTDRDCKGVCGNGVLEAGESCDKGIKTGPGRCPMLADCDDKDSCTRDTLLGVACAVKCNNTPVGPSGTTRDGCCPGGHSSRTDADCLPPCGPDKRKDCVDPCKGVICPPGTYCNNGKCVPFPDLGPPRGGDAGGGGSTSEAGAGGDAAGGGFNDFAGSGCACQAGGPAGSLPLLLLLGLVLVRARRRR